ncbi:MAG: winged helix-turn-helix transcriptional regulator [Acidobacteria bacterium]|nr:winged helix-turn-helix transcriptional regulator [Acidobacteriota bacterium]
MLKNGEISLSLDRGQVFVGKKKIGLTATECNLLACLLEKPGAVLTRQQFINRVWGDTYRGTDRTVDTHMQRLRRKLGRASRRIQTVRGQGYRLASA